MKSPRKRFLFLCSLSLTLPAVFLAESRACTTAVISGRATEDGRPLLWKNRDTRSSQHNEVAIIEGDKFKAVAVVNGGQRKSVWMGVNEVGFCIENSLSRDLAIEKGTSGPGNGRFMRIALGRCETVEDFRHLLNETNTSGRKTVANYGVIDAQGGAVLFETRPDSFTEFDANDPEQAPEGYVVRANFATTARDLPPLPKPERLADIYSGDRYLRAHCILKDCNRDAVSLDEVLRRCTRDLSDKAGSPYPGTINGADGMLPTTIPTTDTISRTTTVSAAVFHGVRPGEDPRLTTMWTLLGDPKFSIAVPVFPCDSVAEDLADKRGGEIGEIALTLREWNLNATRDGVHGANLPGIWNDLWRVEDSLIKKTLRQKERWAVAGFALANVVEWQNAAAHQAMQAMQNELIEAKEASLSRPSPELPTLAAFAASDRRVKADDAIRVALYDHSDHSDGSPAGSKNLRRLLTTQAGFETIAVTPQQIREGVLDEFDLLIMPGGSASKQAGKLKESGREAVCTFVRGGGGYVGICAGSYLASSHYSWSLSLLNAKVWDRVHWARGTGMVSLDVSTSGSEVLKADANRIDVYYGQGPLLVPDDEPSLPGYEVLATYATEVAKKGAPEGAMVGAHAIVRSLYGAGRVICFSPHPEKASGPNSIIIEGVRWAGSGSRASLPSQAACTKAVSPSAAARP